MKDKTWIETIRKIADDDILAHFRMAMETGAESQFGRECIGYAKGVINMAFFADVISADEYRTIIMSIRI